MKKNATTILLLCSVILGLALNGCGSSGSSDSSTTPNQSQSTAVLYGVASLGTTTSGYVSAIDSSEPAQEKIVAIENGSYTVDVSGLKPPYILRAEPTYNPENIRMYSVSRNGGSTNINPISDTAVACAVNGTDPDELFVRPDPDMYRKTADNFESVINSLKMVLAPLFALYPASGDPITDENVDDNTGLQAMFRDVEIMVNSGTVTVTNRQTGGVIFSGPLDNIDSGTFHPENMPSAPGSTPTTCTYLYNPWGACQSDNTQTRTVATSSPSGCTGTPVLSQSCTSVPPPVTTITAANVTSSCTGCHGLTSNSTVFKSGGYSISGRTATDWLTTVNTMIGLGASLTPAGVNAQDYANFLAAQPVTATACASFTYSAWGACQSDSTQTRTVATSSPSGCTGGTPVLSQSCTYVPPTTTCTSFTYSAWGACQSNSTQSRTVASSSPAGCGGGAPVLSQSCTYVPPTSTLTLAQVTTTCTQCHGLTVNTTVLKSGGHSVSGRSASAWVSSITGMFTPPSGTTVQDFANFLAALP